MRVALLAFWLASVSSAHAQLSPNEMVQHIEGRWAPLEKEDDGRYSFDCASSKALEVQLGAVDGRTFFQMREGGGPLRRADLEGVSSNAQGTGSGHLMVKFDDEAHLTFRSTQMLWFISMQDRKIMAMRRADRMDAWTHYYACSESEHIS